MPRPQTCEAALNYYRALLIGAFGGSRRRLRRMRSVYEIESIVAFKLLIR